MNSFVNAVANSTTTDNGMQALASTGHAGLDLFSKVGALRGQSTELIRLFEAALQEDAHLALQIALYTRDIRGGAGERQSFRDMLLYLEARYAGFFVMFNILEQIPEVGRFDDLLIFKTPAIQEQADSVFLSALINGNKLAAKWAPRKGPVAKRLAAHMGWTPKVYRKTIAGKTEVVESLMCAKTFDKINYSRVPSKAMTIYRIAFQQRDNERFEAWKAGLATGETKVNAGAVYPHDVTKMIGNAQDFSYYGDQRTNLYRDNDLATAMWQALPDFMNNRNVIAVVDNSGSMTCPLHKSKVTCMDVAVALGLYTAQKSKGAFKNLSISFSRQAKFVQHDPNSLAASMQAMCSSPWDNTNLESVCDLILGHAIRHNVPQADMPETVVIFSDMQFDESGIYTALDLIKAKYAEANYTFPKIVFWNLNASPNQPCSFTEEGVALVSGFSPSIMKSVLSSDISPLRVMYDALSKYKV